MLHGDQIVPAEILGIQSGRTTRGHRFHHPDSIELGTPREYVSALLEKGHVIVDFDARRVQVRRQVEQAAREIGGHAIINDDLLDEVTSLVEWPVAITGRFDEQFLQVPQEALISSMQGHQRYFPMRDAENRLLPAFIAIANIESREPSAIRAGNERVIRPRLSDAAFFWNKDRKCSLESRIEGQRNVIFQQQLGTLYDKTERVAALADYLAKSLNADARVAVRAAWLCKCDLATEMVGEFPELQGVMGRYYAESDGEPEPVAIALDEQYRPRFAGDDVAFSATGQILAVAERADTLMGIFAIGRGPSGDKDPFGLRRAALGLLRTLIERELDIDLHALLQQAAQRIPGSVTAAEQVESVFEFCLERLRAYYQDQGIPTEVFDAVAACRPTRPLDFHRRLIACRVFMKLPEAASLTAANKRIRNILKKTDGPVQNEVQIGLLRDAEEQALWDAMEEAGREVEPLLARYHYTDALRRLAKLKEPVDRFFDKVLVMAEDPALQANRLALLRWIGDFFLRIADVSRLPAS
jgi:glycyl-tRNA synthetase beta chain